jgi:cytochrome c biogenesis protein CcmG/thiol:disulfide interchange protein DsbE
LAKDKLEIAQSAQKLHIDYPVLIDGASLDKQYGGLDELPMSFFINRKGTVVAAQVGLTSKDDIEANIKKALGN